MPTSRCLPTAAIAVVAALTLVACEDRPTDDASPAAGPTVSPDAAEGVPVGEPVLGEGVHFGFIRTGVAPAVTEPSLTFDAAELFVDEAAQIVAQEDGEVSQGEDLLDDHYIRNRERRFDELPIDRDVVILLIDRDDCCEPVEVDLPTFAAEFEQRQGQGRFVGPDAPYLITVREGRVERIEEVYLP